MTTWLRILELFVGVAAAVSSVFFTLSVWKIGHYMKIGSIKRALMSVLILASIGMVIRASELIFDAEIPRPAGLLVIFLFAMSGIYFWMTLFGMFRNGDRKHL